MMGQEHRDVEAEEEVDARAVHIAATEQVAGVSRTHWS